MLKTYSGAFFSIIYCEWMLKGGVNQWQRYWGGQEGRSPPHFLRRGGNAPPLFLRTEQFNLKLELLLAIHQRMEVAFNYI